MQIQEFQRLFREWLGPDPEEGARQIAALTGYSIQYVRWVAGLVGQPGSWPGSKRFMRKMRRLGCGKPWREQTPEVIRWAFQHREVLLEGG